MGRALADGRREVKEAEDRSALNDSDFGNERCTWKLEGLEDTVIK